MTLLFPCSRVFARGLVLESVFVFMFLVFVFGVCCFRVRAVCRAADLTSFQVPVKL